MYIAKQPNGLTFLFMEKPVKKSDGFWYPDASKYRVDFMEVLEDEVSIPNLTNKTARKVVAKLTNNNAG